MEVFTYTGQRVAKAVKNQFGDTGSVQINDGMILEWINDGQRQICASNPWNEKVFTTDLVAEQQTYNLQTLMAGARPQSFSQIVANDVKLQVLPWAKFTSEVEATTLPTGADRQPILAAEYGGDLVLWPTPDTNVLNGLVVYYVAIPDDLTSLDDQLTIPDRFYNALQRYVLAQALELDENFEASAAVLSQHEQAVAQELQRDKMNPTDYYPSTTFEMRW